jgi:hypothetical protein
VDLVEQFLQTLDSTTLFVQDESKTRADIVAAVRAGQGEIEEAFRLADEVGTHLGRTIHQPQGALAHGCSNRGTNRTLARCG